MNIFLFQTKRIKDNDQYLIGIKKHLLSKVKNKIKRTDKLKTSEGLISPVSTAKTVLRSEFRYINGNGGVLSSSPSANSLEAVKTVYELFGIWNTPKKC